MSTVKANAVTGVTTNNNLALTGNGTGVVTIGDGNLAFPDADGNAAAVIGTNGSAQLSFLDAIASASSNTNLSLSGNGTGGVKVSDYFVQTKGADIASATALTLGKDGNFFDVTGTTTITSIGTQGIGSNIILHFDGALTFTHHATDLILPGGANITTAAGDIAVMYEYASGDWRCVNYSKASGVSAFTNVDQTWTGAQRPTVTALTSTSNAMAINFDDSNDFSHTLTENTTLSAPTGTQIAGQSGSIFITQHASSPKTLGFNAEYLSAGGTDPVITATNSAKDRIDYVIRADGVIEITSVLALA